MNKDLTTAYQLMSLHEAGETARSGGKMTTGSKLDFHKMLSKLPGLPWAKYSGEKHLPGYNYAGPGTALDKRLDENDNPLPNSKPINRVDEAAYRHDLAYRAAGDAEQSLILKHAADKKMIEELNNIENPTLRERIDAPLVRTALQAKVRLGLGVDKASLAAIRKTSLAAELYKPYRKPKEYLTVKVFNLNDIWTADLMFMHDLIVLVVMDCYSRFVWVEVLANKTAKTTKAAFEKIIKRAGVYPKKLWCDRGTEFNLIKTIQDPKEPSKNPSIDVYHTNNEGKAVLAERVIRTIKEKMYKMYTDTRLKSWKTILNKVVEKYNKTIHSSINETPSNAFKDPELIREKITDHNFQNEAKATNDFTKPKPKKYKFKVGDKVRIFKYKNKFEKGYTAKWTNEIFTIDKVLGTSPVTYALKDLDKEPILGKFYTEELQKTLF